MDGWARRVVGRSLLNIGIISIQVTRHIVISSIAPVTLSCSVESNPEACFKGGMVGLSILYVIQGVSKK